MTENKRFKRFAFADGFKIVAIKDNGKIMNSKQVCNKLNELHEENEMRKEYQRTLEDKIRRLKDRVKTFEKHYSLKDIERLRRD